MIKMRRIVTLLLLGALCLAGAAQAQTDTYTASGTWTAPTGVTTVSVEVWGGGGAGGGNPTNSDGGGGGGGGGYSTSTISVVPGTGYMVVVGAGGTGVVGGNGNAGGQSYFISTATVRANGGAGGAVATSAGGAGGAGGALGVGTTRFSGGNGGVGLNDNTGQGGPGGSSAGTGANGTNGPSPWSTVTQSTAQPAPTGGGIGGDGATNADGNPPDSGYGGGGGGSGDRSGPGGDRKGGNGAGGKVAITYTSPPPTVATNAATALSDAGATLNGVVSSNGASTTVTFDYGLTTGYGFTTTAAQSPLAAGASGTAVTAAVTGLTCNTLYHFRVKGVNSAGTTNGSDLSFTTSACTSTGTVTANPTLCVNDASIGVVTGNWTGLTNVGSQNNIYAQASVANTDITNYLKCTGYGFSIPAGATITGITVGPWLNSTYTMRDNAMQLVKGGVIQTTNLAIGANIPNGGGALAATPTQFTYGGSTNLWGNTWSAANINSASFGAAFAAQRGGFASTQQAAVDAMPITIDYTLPSFPTVASIDLASSNPATTGSFVSWTVVFSASVTGVDAADFALVQAGGASGASITSVYGSGTTWTVTANTGSGTGTLGLNLVDNDSIIDGSGTPLGGTGAGNGNFTGQVYTIGAEPVLAEYRMDAVSWNGTANEVVDSSGNGNNASSFNSANTDGITPAIAGSPGTCRYGVFDDGSTITSGYIQTPLPDLTTDFTVTAWIRTTNYAPSGQRILIDDQNNTGGYGISLGDGAAGRIRFYSRAINPVILDSNFTIVNDTWYFVSAVADITNRIRTIYVFNSAGVLQNSTSDASAFTGTWGTDTGPVSIGGETNASGEATAGFHFHGNLDEVRVYQKALSQSALAAIATQTHLCAVSGGPDHFAIAHDGSGVNCQSEPVTISDTQARSTYQPRRATGTGQ
jgi:hypothetical protein